MAVAAAAATNPPFTHAAALSVATLSDLAAKTAETEKSRSRSRSRTGPIAHQISVSPLPPRRSSDAAHRRPGSRDKRLDISPTREYSNNLVNPPPPPPLTSTDAQQQSRSFKSTRIDSPSKATFHLRPDTRKTASPPAAETPGPQQQQSPSLSSTSISLKPPRTPSHEPKPGRLKRSPASHSSYGVETACGPPPSISTQRALPEDRLWRPTGTDYPIIPPPNLAFTESISPTHELITDATERPDQEISSQEDNSTPELLDGSLESDEAEGDATLRAMDASTDEETKGSSAGSREDLFLNIAKVEEDKSAVARAERRRVSVIRTRIEFSFSQRSLLVLLHFKRAEQTSMTDNLQSWGLHASVLSPRFSQDPSRPKTGHSSARFTSAGSNYGNDDSARIRYNTGIQKPSSISVPRSVVGRDMREESPESPAGFKRRGSNAESTGRTYRQSNLGTLRSGRIASTSVADSYVAKQMDADRQRIDGTESTISTNAPSTVWDELDDLKSRIRKLELTGKLPPSSAAAMSTPIHDRPQTATTTITTISSSPKHGRKKDSPIEATLNGTPSSVHPLLHEALSNARSTIDDEVYHKLEAAASDALQLASLMSGAQTSGQSVIGGGSTNERQARRRVDSLCRGLTELSIALAAQSPRPATSAARPMSRDASAFSLQDGPTKYRRSSLGPDDRGLPTPRVQSRLEPRRSSMIAGGRLDSPRFSPETAINEEQRTQPQRVGSRLNRNSLPLRNRRAHGLVEGANDEDEDDGPQPRPVSRAMTEAPLSSFRQSPRDRPTFAREYTSQHPLPARETNRDYEASPQTPSGSTIPRRSYVSSNLGSSPITQTTPTNTTGIRRYGTTGSAISTLSTRTVKPSNTNSFPSALPDPPPDSPAMDENMQRRASLRERLGAASSRIISSSVGSRLRAAKDSDDRRRSRNFDLDSSRRASEAGLHAEG